MSIFWGMRYLDFSTPKSVMRSIFFEVFIRVKGVCPFDRVCVFVCVYVEGGDGSGDSDYTVEC